MLDIANVRRTLDGAAQAVLAAGFAYDARLWKMARPTAMANMVEGCPVADARLVFIDDLYQPGPQTTPRTEDMPQIFVKACHPL